MATVRDFLRELQATQLNDVEGITWDTLTLFLAMNRALNTLVLMRPDASTKVVQMELVAGTRQSIPADGYLLINVVRNIRTDGGDGRAVSLVSKDDMDLSPNWHQISGKGVEHYIFDSRAPKTFFIYPRVNAGSKVEIEYSAHLPTLTEDNLGDEMPVDSEYEQPLYELMLYKLLSGDSGQAITGQGHLSAAATMLGVKIQGEASSSPSKKYKGKEDG